MKEVVRHGRVEIVIAVVMPKIVLIAKGQGSLMFNQRTSHEL
jgi:hypothetical protein